MMTRNIIVTRIYFIILFFLKFLPVGYGKWSFLTLSMFSSINQYIMIVEFLTLIYSKTIMWKKMSMT